MAARFGQIAHLFSVRNILAGLVLGFLLFAFTILVLFLLSGGALQEMEEKLASEVVTLDSRAQMKDQSNTAKAVEKVEIPPEISTDPAQLDMAPEKIGALKSAPIDGLYETTKIGLLPVKNESKNLTPFEAYARPYTGPADQAKISIAVLDYGLSEETSESLLSLPGEITFILSPYSAKAEFWQRQARKEGHEVWLHLPMETPGFPLNDPGPRAILSTDLLDKNKQKLRWALSRTPGYSGVVGYYDNSFQENKLMFSWLISSIFDRGLGYLELNPQADALVQNTAEKKQSPYGMAVLDLSADDWGADISPALSRLETRAKKQGNVIAVTRPVPFVLDKIKTWQKTLATRGVVLAPLSAVTAYKAESEKTEISQQ